MAGFFSGWIGYGSGVQASTLTEPSDSAYSRRPIIFSVLEGQSAFDIAGGTVGPASNAWGSLKFAGLFDAQVGGNLLVVFPLPMPVSVSAGSTYTTAIGGNVFSGLGHLGGQGTQSFPAGTVIGFSPGGRAWTTNIAVQISAGVLTAQTSSFGTNVTMASLPAAQPAAGSGQLWNDGGVVAIS